MSTLKLKGSTSGYVELTAPATAGDNQIVLPTTAGTVAVKDASNNTEVGTGVTIGSPSSNTFTVSTNGGERVRVDSSGRLLVGTDSTSSVSSLVVESSSSANHGIIYLARDNAPPSSTSALGQINFSDNGHIPSVQIAGRQDGGSWIPGTSHPSKLEFLTAENGTTSLTTRATIDSSGRLLVGTASGSGTSLLQVQEQRLNGGNGYSQSKTVQIALASSSTDNALFNLASTGTSGVGAYVFRSGVAFNLSVFVTAGSSGGGYGCSSYRVSGMIEKRYLGNLTLHLGTPEQEDIWGGLSAPTITIKLINASQTAAQLAIDYSGTFHADIKIAAMIQTIGAISGSHGPITIN